MEDKMVKVLFVCLGNICRSPMAEFVFKELVRKNGLEDYFFIESAATSSEEVGNGIHIGTRRKLTEKNIPYTSHVARKMTKEDYNEFDYLIGMEDSNILNMKRICGEDKDSKIYKLLDFTSNSRNIADPWYSGDFDKTYEDVLEGCESFLEFVCRNLDFK